MHNLSVMHMLDACLNCAASFESLACIVLGKVMSAVHKALQFGKYMYVIQGDIILQQPIESKLRCL